MKKKCHFFKHLCSTKKTIDLFKKKIVLVLVFVGSTIHVLKSIQLDVIFKEIEKKHNTTPHKKPMQPLKLSNNVLNFKFVHTTSGPKCTIFVSTVTYRHEYTHPFFKYFLYIQNALISCACVFYTYRYMYMYPCAV